MGLFVDYGVEDISPKLVIPSLAFSLITPLFIIARFVTRWVYMRSFGPDDWAILGSCVFSETISIQMIIICQWAFGKHRTDIPLPLLAKSLKLYWFAQILYKLNIALTKISILLLYIKIFGRPSWISKASWICIGVVIAFTTGTTFSSIFQCNPVQYAFNKQLPSGGQCINLKAFWFANAGFNISSDFVIIALPLPILARLHMPKKTRIALCGVFAVGLVVCVTSILRITTLHIASSHLDIPFTNIPSSMWTVIEINLGVICACLPVLWRPLSSVPPAIYGHVKSAYGKRFSTTSLSNSKSRSSYGSKGTLSSSTTPATTRLQSMDRWRVPRRGDVWTEMPQFKREGAVRGNSASEAGSEGRGSQDPIVTNEGDEGDAVVQGSQIRKTTQVVVEYDINRSNDHDNSDDTRVWKPNTVRWASNDDNMV